MKVFISWSGSRSKQIAEELRKWLPSVIQSLEPWCSSNDIGAGKVWGSELRAAMQDAQFAIVCLTPENIQSPWIHYEAGGIAEKLNGKVTPYLYDFTQDNLKGPLKQLQMVEANKAGTIKLLKALNDCNSKSLETEVLTKSIDRWWPDLEKALSIIPSITFQPFEPSGSPYEGYWESKWLYGEEICKDLLHIECIDKDSGDVFGKRIVITGEYKYLYTVKGLYLGDSLYIIADNADMKIPIAVSLVLKPKDKFFNELGGIAIRPAGNDKPNPAIEDSLFYNLNFWAGLTTYKAYSDISKYDKQLYDAYQELLS